MIEYKAYHKKSLGKRKKRAHAAHKKGKDKNAAAAHSDAPLPRVSRPGAAPRARRTRAG